MPLCLPLLAHLQEKICTLESVNGVLVTASDQCTQQILAFQQQEKIEIAKLKEERLYLLKLIDKMKEEKCSLETQASLLPCPVHTFKQPGLENWIVHPCQHSCAFSKLF